MDGLAEQPIRIGSCGRSVGVLRTIIVCPAVGCTGFCESVAITVMTTAVGTKTVAVGTGVGVFEGVKDGITYKVKVGIAVADGFNDSFMVAVLGTGVQVAGMARVGSRTVFVGLAAAVIFSTTVGMM